VPAEAQMRLALDHDIGRAIIGAPDEALEQLREVAVNLNAGNLGLLLQSGNMGKQLTQRNQHLFAEWEHRRWPKPMAAARRAG
jgi:hypothetical protein